MSNECLNILEVDGAPDEVAALAAKANLAAGYFLRSLLGDVRHVDQAERPSTRDKPREIYEVAKGGNPDEGHVSFTLITKAEAPVAYAKLVAEEHPSLTFRLATVEPGNKVAGVLVLRGADAWSHEPADLDWDALQGEDWDAESDNPEEKVLDALYAESDSVFDDYKKRGAGPAPK